jgi:putative nucleotide binding protein
MMDRHRGRKEDRRVAREDYAIVLDYMPQGNPVDMHHPSHRTRPIAQAIGDKYFTLLEFYPKPGVSLTQGEKVYVGFRRRELRDKVEYVWGEPIRYDDLTGVAKSYLPEAIKQIVLSREKVFVTFFNIAAPLTIKLHSLELLPGIGKKTMWLILDERRKKPFQDFEDIKERCKIQNPVEIIVERILSELRGEERYYLFLDPPPGTENAIVLGYLHRIYRLLRSEGGAGFKED